MAAGRRTSESRLRQVRPEQTATPDAERRARRAGPIADVLDVRATFGGFLGGVGGPGDAWDVIRASTAAVLADADSIDGTVDAPDFGVTPRERILAIATNDMLIHTWNLSRAIGIDDTFPVDCFDVAIDGIETFPPEVRSQLFAPPIATDPAASLQDRMLGVAGRRP